MPTKATASEGVVTATGNDFLDTLIIGDKWNDDHPVTFYFDNGTTTDDVWLNSAKNALRNVFSSYEKYINLEFEEVDNQADANFVLRMNSLDEIGATARFGYPDESDSQAVGQFPFDWSRWTGWHLQPGGYAYHTVLHEVGHGLGLGHPHGTGGLNGQPFSGVSDAGDVGNDGQNNGIFTVMSYLDHSQFWAPVPATSDLGWGYMASPMGLDIAALQHIYGANPTTNSGNNTYTLPIIEDDGTYWQAIWDTGGTDRIRHTGAAPATIDLRPAPLVGPNAGGYLSRVDGIAGGFTIANGVTIEYAEGGHGDDTLIGNGADNEIAGRGGHDTITGNGGDDLLDGGEGDDFVSGGTGDDTLIGGAGDDTFMVDTALDELHEGANDGTDTVISTVTHTLGAHFENLHLAESGIGGIDGTGNTAANQIIGNSDGNTVEGRAGDDFVNGGAGGDVIDGGTGEDTLLGGDGEDFLDGGEDESVLLMAVPVHAGTGGQLTTLRNPDLGIDVVLTDQRSALTAGDDDELHGGDGDDELTGRGGDDELHGDAGDDTVFGGSGADWLDGGTGQDSMIGGGQNDIYVVDSDLDTVHESAGNGIDGVFSAVNYELGAHVENLALTGGANHHISGAGNGLDNWIAGNAGSNVIDGLGGDDLLAGFGGVDYIDGGTGGDAMFGGEGNDILDGGDDDILVLGLGPARFAPAFGFQDVLFGGMGQDILYGRGGADELHGENGQDEIYGEDGSDTAYGGEGIDIVGGGAGADLLFGEDDNDVLAGDGGNDTLRGGAGADSINGGSGLDALFGGAGRDTIMGGTGRDAMNGGAGADRFVFSDITHFGTTAASRDDIDDFTHAVDRIDLIGIDAVPGGGDDAFAFVGTGAFTGVGQVRVVASNGHTIVQLNTEAGGGAESAILLRDIDAATITGADFLLLT